LDGRPEPELRAGKELEDGASHDVRGRVPQRVQRFVAVIGFALGFWHRPPPNKNRPRPFLGREAISRFHPASPTPIGALRGWLYGAYPIRAAVVGRVPAPPGSHHPRFALLRHARSVSASSRRLSIPRRGCLAIQ